MQADQATRETTTLARVRQALGDALVVYGGPGCVPPPRAKLALHVAAPDEDLTSFGRWARSARLPAVALTFEGDRILVGPLSAPGHPGCAECARRRMLAAKAASFGAVTPQVGHIAAAAPGMGLALRRPDPKAMATPHRSHTAADDDPDRTSAVAGSVIRRAGAEDSRADDPDRTAAVAGSLAGGVDEDVDRTSAVARSVIAAADEDVDRTAAAAGPAAAAANDRTSAAAGSLAAKANEGIDRTAAVPGSPVGGVGEDVDRTSAVARSVIAAADEDVDRTVAVAGSAAGEAKGDVGRASAVAGSFPAEANEDIKRTADPSGSAVAAAKDDLRSTSAVAGSLAAGVDDDVDRTSAVARSVIAAADEDVDRTVAVSGRAISTDGPKRVSPALGVTVGRVSAAIGGDDPDRTDAVSGLLYGRLPTDPDQTSIVRDNLTKPDPADDVTEPTGGDPQADRVVALLRDGARDLVDHVAEVVDGEVVWHRVIPLPSCDVCGGAQGIGTVGLPEGDNPVALLEALAGWVDPLTGVIPWISLKQPLGTGPDLPFVATAAPPHHIDADGRAKALPIGWGKGATRAEAILSAVGEAVERYAPSLPEAEKLVWARPADLAGDVLDPREFPLYEPESYARPGFGFAAFDRRTDHPWVRGTWLGTARPVWVPAVFTYLAMTLLPEHLICQGTSNGLAAGVDAESATVRAVLELVERDAMMAAWLTGAKGRFVELDDTLDPDLRAIVDALRTQGVTVEVYLLPTSTYGVTAAALALGDGKRRPGATLGLGADRSPSAAIRAAVLELAQTASHLAGLMRERPVPRRPEDVREMLDHAAYYFPLDRVAAFDRLRCGGTSRLRDLREPVAESSVTDLAHVLGAAKVRVAVVDVTSADVATGPFRVVRAVSPDLQPISYGHGNDRSLVARLRGRTLPANRANIHPIW